jgi:hypothetical protein
MASFHFRLARVLDWYGRKCRLEENRLHMLAEGAARAAADVERHTAGLLAHRMELIRSPNLRAFELAAMESFARQARREEAQLRQTCQTCMQMLEKQREVVRAAQQRFRLVEKLCERRREEHRLQDERELEELASESYLAGFARGIGNNL